MQKKLFVAAVFLALCQRHLRQPGRPRSRATAPSGKLHRTDTWMQCLLNKVDPQLFARPEVQLKRGRSFRWEERGSCTAVRQGDYKFYVPDH